MKTMSNYKYAKAVKEAKQVTDTIDAFIAKIKRDNYMWAALIYKRMIKQMESDDLEDVLFEMELEQNIRSIKIDSLVGNIEFDAFKENLETNPYQFKLAI